MIGAAILTLCAGLSFSHLVASATDQIPDGNIEAYQRGAFLGLASGDAEGALTETFTPEQIKKTFGRFYSVTEPLPLRRILEVRGRKNYRRLRIPGYVTDDTQQAMALILIFLQNPTVVTRIDPNTQTEHSWWAGLNAFAHLLIDGSNARAWRGQGGSFEAAVGKLRQMNQLVQMQREPARAGAWDQLRLKVSAWRGSAPNSAPIFDVRRSGAPVDSIGAAMRTGPLGALVSYPEDLIETVVIQSSLVTHADVRAVAMAYAMFKAVRSLIERRPLDELRADLVRQTERVESRLLAMSDWPMNRTDPHAVSRTMGQIFDRIGRAKTNEQVSMLVERFGRPARYNWRKRRPYTASSGVATLSGLHALSLGLADLVDPRAVISYAVNFGDDSDTVAAMAGSILGARLGTSWIAAEVLPDHERLMTYATALHTGAPPESISEYLEREVRLTENEVKFQSLLPTDPPAAACVRRLESVSAVKGALLPAPDLFD